MKDLWHVRSVPVSLRRQIAGQAALNGLTVAAYLAALVRLHDALRSEAPELLQEVGLAEGVPVPQNPL